MEGSLKKLTEWRKKEWRKKEAEGNQTKCEEKVSSFVGKKNTCKIEGCEQKKGKECQFRGG